MSYFSARTPLPNDKILDLSKLKAFVDDKMNVAKMMIYVFDTAENIVGKGENIGYQHFLLFPQSFQKAFSSGVLKVGIVLPYNPFPDQPWFLCVHSTSFENTVGKGEIAHYEQFLLFPQCFLPILENFLPFSSNLKLSSANTPGLEESKICCLGKGELEYG